MALLAAISLMAWLSFASTAPQSPYQYARDSPPQQYSNYYREPAMNIQYKPAVPAYGPPTFYTSAPKARNDYYTNSPKAVHNDAPKAVYTNAPKAVHADASKAFHINASKAIYTSVRPSYPSYTTTSSPKSNINIKFLSTENLMNLTKGTTSALTSILNQLFNKLHLSALQSTDKDPKDLKADVLKPLTKDSDDPIIYPTAAYNEYNGYNSR